MVWKVSWQPRRAAMIHGSLIQKFVASALPSCSISVEQVRLTLRWHALAALGDPTALPSFVEFVCLEILMTCEESGAISQVCTSCPSIWLLRLRGWYASKVSFNSPWNWSLETQQNSRKKELKAESLCIWIWFRLKMLEHAHPAAQCRNCFSTFRAL